MNLSDIAAIPQRIRENIQVNLPFRMRELYMEAFLSLGLNPEIGIDALSLDSSGWEDFKAVAGAFQKKGRRITLHGPFMDLSPGSPDSAVRRISMERIQQFLELVPVFNPVSVVCHGGWESRRYDWIKDEWYARSADFWKGVAGDLGKNNCQLFLENVYEEHPEELLLLLEHLRAEKVGVCLDTGHQSAFGSGDLSHWLGVMGPFIGEIHLHDNNGKEDSHLPPGQGVIDYTPLKKMFYAQGKLPIITLEPHEPKNLLPSMEWLVRELGELF
ncbi:sugar phosphate isomerase/epimerase family protein [Desulfobotulus mexicanus]|uniref:Sugar phosphate isomerase/epimerase n=1 Tax=Desulfobotulus mexicanus TaxID=2586642 RepID=A0A5S5MEQ4_9BACT|nr:sugar phosphate isomerase/epimerase family protein [Desulfobotulus mexicanus]TYT74184.1 sugar phosphate isomerase/epimerase [Desulfobotulus mexicanus]